MIRWACAIVVVAVTACGSPAPVSSTAASSSPSEIAETPPPSTVTPTRVAVLNVAASRYGRIVIDDRGHALYLFDLERDGVPRCYGACAVAWPPYLARAATASSSELRADRVGVIRRQDGAMQVTYNGHPLYFYVGDRQPGQILCQAVTEYGGGWYVVGPKGDKITAT